MKKILSTIGVVSGCLIFSAVHSQVKAQARTITGQVNDGEKPINGVVVTQEGTNHLTTTTETGAFFLQITGENPILIFRHPEYGERKIPTDGKSTFTIALTGKVKSIEEVVLNAGYYNVKAKESTGSISKVTAKDIENQPVNNVLSAVQGRMAGVNITQNSGNAGGGYDVQIRGRNSLRNSINSLTDGNVPLYVVDGVPISGQLISNYSIGTIPLQSINPLNSLNPNDIESIEVLKDADATAIYGSRGGNGVILITTKKGKASPIRLTVNTSHSFSRVARTLEMMQSADYITMRKQAFANVGTVTLPGNAYDINGAWDQTRYTDWQKELIGGTAENSSIQVGISGGSDKNSFSVSAGHNDQTSVFPGDHHYKMYTLSSHYNHRSTDNAFTLGLSNTFTSSTNNNLNQDFTAKALNLSPNAPGLYNEAGNLNWQNNTFANPLAQLNASYSNTTKYLYQNLNASYRFLKDFTFKLNGGFGWQDLEEFSLVPNTVNNPAFASGASSATSSASRGTSSVFSYLLEPQISWSKKRGNHTFQVLSGLTFQENRRKGSAMNGLGFASNSLLQNIAAAATVTLSDFSDTQYKYAALFGRVNYQFLNRYIVNLTARRDGSSRFGPNNRFANFGAVGAAWILSEENFLKDRSWLSFAKLRGSFGRTGSDAIGDFQFTDAYSLGYSAYNNIPGMVPSRLYNPDFSWEKTDKLEAAAELSFLKGRINLTTAWYRNRSSNQLVGIPLPAITGFTSIQGNLAATVENSGYEMELNTTNVESRDWKWTTGFNISLPQNRLIAFTGLERSTYANKYVIGESIYVVKLFDYKGINAAGKYEFTDHNSDGKITADDDAKALRTLSPQYFGGFTNTLRYKNFNFSLLFQFVKQEGWNYFRTMSSPGAIVNQPVEFLDVWSPTNLDGIIMPYTPGNHAPTNLLTGQLRNSTAAVGDASYIRLKNIHLSYNIPLHNSVVREANVYVQGQNLWTYTKYFGLDPEMVTSGFLPPLKTLSMGLQLTF